MATCRSHGNFGHRGRFKHDKNNVSDLGAARSSLRPHGPAMQSCGLGAGAGGRVHEEDAPLLELSVPLCIVQSLASSGNDAVHPSGTLADQGERKRKMRRRNKSIHRNIAIQSST